MGPIWRKEATGGITVERISPLSPSCTSLSASWLPRADQAVSSHRGPPALPRAQSNGASQSETEIMNPDKPFFP